MTRRGPTDARAQAEKAFKAATTKPAPPLPEPAAKATSPPGAKETVSLRIDRDVLDYFQADGPGWQERINAALRKAAVRGGRRGKKGRETRRAHSGRRNIGVAINDDAISDLGAIFGRPDGQVDVYNVRRLVDSHAWLCPIR